MDNRWPIKIDNPTSLLLLTDKIQQFDCRPRDFQLDPSDQKSSAYENNYRQMNQHLRDSFVTDDKSAVTYVMYSASNDIIIGYYTITMGTSKLSKRFRDSSKIVGRNGNIGYPCVDVPFLAVDKNFQRNGYGTLLLEHLMLNVYWQIIPVIGADLVRLDALENIKGFYDKHGFIPYSQDHLKKRLVPMGVSAGAVAETIRLNGTITNEEKSIRIMLENTLLIFQ